PVHHDSHSEYGSRSSTYRNRRRWRSHLRHPISRKIDEAFLMAHFTCQERCCRSFTGFILGNLQTMPYGVTIWVTPGLGAGPGKGGALCINNPIRTLTMATSAGLLSPASAMVCL